MGAKPTTYDDPVFGTLSYVAGDLWKRPFGLDIFGRWQDGWLYVDIDPDEGLEQHQIDAFDGLSRAPERAARDAENAVFRYHLSLVADGEHELPPAKAAQTIFPMIAFQGITFPYAHSLPTYGLLFKPSWEVERGLAVKFENNQVVEVGFQDIIL